MAQLADSDDQSSTRLTVDVKNCSLHVAKAAPLRQKLLFSFTLTDSRESPEPLGPQAGELMTLLIISSCFHVAGLMDRLTGFTFRVEIAPKL